MEGPPLLVQVLCGNPVTAALVLQCIHTADATVLRRLHPALVAAVAAVPWADMSTWVSSTVRWRAAFPAAVGASVACFTVRSLMMSQSNCWEAADEISHMPPSLTALNLRLARVPPTVSFSHLTALLTLDCSGTDAVSDGVARLPPSLRELRIDHCRLSPSADFSHLRALQRLFCSKVKLSAGVVAGLPPSLECLDTSTGTGREEDEEIEDTEVIDNWPRRTSLAHLPQLRILRTARCRIGYTSVATLSATLAELDMSHCAILSKYDHLHGLRTLQVADSSFDDRHLASLPPSLVWLNASWCHCLSAAAVLPPLPALRTLNLSHSGIGDAAVASMPPNLVALYLVSCCNVTSRASLDHLVALRVLYVEGTRVSVARQGCVDPAAGRELRGHTKRVCAMALLGDGRLVTGSDDGTVRLWDTEDPRGGAAVVLHVPVEGGLVALAALPDGHRVGVASSRTKAHEGGVIVWDARAAIEPGPTPRLQGVSIYRGDVRDLVALNDGTLAVACEDGAARVYDVDTGAVVTTLPVDGRAGALATLSCGKLAIGAGGLSVLQVWDVERVRCVAAQGMECATIVQLADGRIATRSAGTDVEVVDASFRPCSHHILKYHRRIDTTALAPLSDGRLACGTNHGDVVVWDTRVSARHAVSNTPVRHLGTAGGLFLFGHNTNAAITALLPLPGSRLASATYGGTVYLWDVPPA